jgi:hypothetical protein
MSTKATVCIPVLLLAGMALNAQVDPGVRGGPAGAGGPLPGLSAGQGAFFLSTMAFFQAANSVRRARQGPGPGLQHE